MAHGNPTTDYQQALQGGLGPPHQRDAAAFYKDATLFVTGMTGFVGKVVVWKLLADLRDIKRIYVLIRWV